MDINEIEGQWSESVNVWVRPAQGDWQAITDALNFWDRGKTEWRPAMISGFSDDQWAYNTHNDPRKIRLIGSQYSYGHALFEIGAIMEHNLEQTAVLTGSPAP